MMLTDLWQAAMDDEIQSLKENGTWEEVDPPAGRRIVDNKWVYKINTIHLYLPSLIFTLPRSLSTNIISGMSAEGSVSAALPSPVSQLEQPLRDSCHLQTLSSANAAAAKVT